MRSAQVRVCEHNLEVCIGLGLIELFIDKRRGAKLPVTRRDRTGLQTDGLSMRLRSVPRPENWSPNL